MRRLLALALTCVIASKVTHVDDYLVPVLTNDHIAGAIRSAQDASYLDVMILQHCGEIAIEHYANVYTATRLNDTESATLNALQNTSEFATGMGVVSPALDYKA